MGGRWRSSIVGQRRKREGQSSGPSGAILRSEIIEVGLSYAERWGRREGRPVFPHYAKSLKNRSLYHP